MIYISHSIRNLESICSVSGPGLGIGIRNELNKVPPLKRLRCGGETYKQVIIIWRDKVTKKALWAPRRGPRLEKANPEQLTLLFSGGH